MTRYARLHALPALLCLLAACGGKKEGDGWKDGIHRVHGVCFSPVVRGQSLRSKIGEEQIAARLGIVAPYTEWVRTLSCGDDLRNLGAIAHGMGLKTLVSAWIDGDLENNERQLAALVDEAAAGMVDIAVVGGEVLLRGDLEPAALVDYIRRARAAVPPGVPVSTVDSYLELYRHPEVVDACDVVTANFYPFWEGLDVTEAVARLAWWHRELAAAAGGKRVIIAETGWPSDGVPERDAIPSQENAAFYFAKFVEWARDADAEYFYFEAFDEGWKEVEGPMGPHWGIWDEDGVMKPGRESVFSR